MCLAVPMEVIELREGVNVALVRLEGIEKEVFLDIVDNMPEKGDYVLVHAGFAIHTISREDVSKTFELLKGMNAVD